jgi:hypothetical protein
MELTPKEKAEIHAKDMFLKMYSKIEDITAGMFEEDVPYLDLRYRAAKECCIIAVDEILTYNINPKCESQFVIEQKIEVHFNEVKQALNKL